VQVSPRRLDGFVAKELLSKDEISRPAPEMVAGRMAELVHWEVRGPGALEATLEPAMKR
jgi:hypothetical protein